MTECDIVDCKNRAWGVIEDSEGQYWDVCKKHFYENEVLS